MSDELKPCPFCGGDYLRIQSTYVHCNSCGGDGPEVSRRRGREYWGDLAIKAWNTRHTPEAVKGIVEALEGWVDNHRYLDDAQVRELYESYENNPLYSKIIKARAALKAYKIHIGE